MDSPKQNIAIIGCGPAGLSAAIYLRRQGIGVTIYEQFQRARPIGSGLMMQPSGMSVLHELGLLEKVLERGKRVEHIFGRDAFSAKPVLDVHYRDLGGDHFGLGIHRHSLFTVLYECAIAEGVTFELGSEIVSVENDSDGIRPVNQTGATMAKYDFVIVASGSDSEIAQSLFGKITDKKLPYGALWATLDWPDESELNNNMLEQRYRGASKMVGVLPLGNDGVDGGQQRVALFWSIKGCDIAELKSLGLQKWKDEVKHHWPQTKPLLAQISDFDDLTFADYHHYTLKKPYSNRIAFIGDAWHSTSPQLGQGANMALLDAKAIDFAVRECGGDLAGMGEKFHGLRKRQIHIYQALSKMLTPFYQSDSTALGFARDHIVSHLVKIPPAPKLMTGMVSGLFAHPFKAGLLGQGNVMELNEPEWAQFK